MEFHFLVLSMEGYMVQSHIGHLVFHINPQNLGFYKELLTFLGWSVCYDDPAMLGGVDSQGADLWFGGALKAITNDYDSPGLNHLGLSVNSIADVDTAVAWLKEHGTPALFETPRHRPEFCRRAALITR